MRRTTSLLAVVALVASGCTLVGGALGPTDLPGSSAATPVASPLTSPEGSEPPSAITEPSAPPATEEPATEAPATATPEPAHSSQPTLPTPTSQPPEATASPPASVSPVPEQGFAPKKLTLSLEKVADGLNNPLFITGDGTGSGRRYILERAGLVKVMLPNGKVRDKPVLDLRGRVATDGERGLLGIAFHPNFAKNGRFFVDYSSADANGVSGQTWLVEYQMDDPDAQVAADSGRVVMNFARPDWNHNGGWIGFGPDGYLYVASGDGGGNSPGDPHGNGQDRSDLLGSILRIDVDGKKPYAIPADNPWADGANGSRPELWDYGLRNPWRDSFDTQTGDLWIGDVGQDLREEVDVQRAGKGGANFGWSVTEGTLCHRSSQCDRSRFTLPVAEYPHSPACSVVGGYVYRGTQQPLLFGGYLFADYCSGMIWGIDARGAKAGDDLKPKKLLDTKLNWVSFGQDDAGELYLVSFGGGIYHLVAKPNG